MNKKIIISILVVVVIGIVVGGFFFFKGGCTDPMTEADALKFKAEYESLNSEIGEDGNPVHKALHIDVDNNVIYLKYADLLAFADSGNGILYFGRPGCPRCRDLLPIMLDFSKERNVAIHYYNIEQDRTEHNDQYQHILSLFDAYLPVDTVTQNEEDPDFDPTLKRVILPHLFFIEKGEIKADLYAFQHEYLAYGEIDNMKRLLVDKYTTISSNTCAPTDC